MCQLARVSSSNLVVNSKFVMMSSIIAPERTAHSLACRCQKHATARRYSRTCQSWRRPFSSLDLGTGRAQEVFRLASCCCEEREASRLPRVAVCLRRVDGIPIRPVEPYATGLYPTAAGLDADSDRSKRACIGAATDVAGKSAVTTKPIGSSSSQPVGDRSAGQLDQCRT